MDLWIWISTARWRSGRVWEDVGRRFIHPSHFTFPVSALVFQAAVWKDPEASSEWKPTQSRGRTSLW